MKYLLQLLNASHLQKTLEVTANTLEGLQMGAVKMVRDNPEIKGMTYRIFKMPVKPNGMADTLKAAMIKEAVIAN